MKEDLLRALPSVDEIMRQDWMQDVIKGAGRSLAVRAVQELIAERRAELLAGDSVGAESVVASPGLDSSAVRGKIEQLAALSLQPLINATGIIV